MAGEAIDQAYQKYILGVSGLFIGLFRRDLGQERAEAI